GIAGTAARMGSRRSSVIAGARKLPAPARLRVFAAFGRGAGASSVIVGNSSTWTGTAPATVASSVASVSTVRGWLLTPGQLATGRAISSSSPGVDGSHEFVRPCKARTRWTFNGFLPAALDQNGLSTDANRSIVTPYAAT